MDAVIFQTKKTQLFVSLFLTALTVTLPHITLARDSGIISEIEVSGNNRLTNTEITNLCPIDLGRHINSSELKTLLACLANTNQFDSIDLDINAGRLLISVMERILSKGKISVGLSVSSNRGPAVQIEAVKPMLFNRPLTGRIKVQSSEESTAANIVLEDNNLLGRPYKGKLNLNFLKNSFDERTYDDKRTRIAASLEFPIKGSSKITLKAGVQKSSMYNIATTASPIIAREIGSFTNGFVGISYSIQSTPKRNARSHYKAKISQTLFLGNRTVKYGETRLEASSDTRIIDNHRLKIAFEGGAITPFSNTTTRSIDRFFLGGSFFRGFAPGGIGPIDGATHLGGNYYAVTTIETRSPIASWEKIDIEGGIFTSIGSVWNLNDTAGVNGAVNDSAFIHASLGASFILNTKTVPIHFYYAIPIKKKNTSKQQEFGFYVSSSF